MKKKKNGLKGRVKFFSVNFNPIYTKNVLDIHKYLMKGTQYKLIFEIIKIMPIENSNKAYIIRM